MSLKTLRFFRKRRGRRGILHLSRWIALGRSRLDRGGEERAGRPELGPNPTAPWPVMASFRQSVGLEHNSRNRRHREIE